MGEEGGVGEGGGGGEVMGYTAPCGMTRRRYELEM